MSQSGAALVCAATYLALAAVSLPAGVAQAGQSRIACEYVGDRENNPGFGAGRLDMPRQTRSRFAGSGRRLAQGAPPGTGGVDFAGIPVPRSRFQTAPACTCSATGIEDPFSSGAQLKERFVSDGTLRVQGADGRSLNGRAVVQNVPTCIDPTGAGSHQIGFPALFQWTVGFGHLVNSDIHLEICLDVRKCQQEQDSLGAGMTVPIIDFLDEFGPEGPPTVRVIHHLGDLRTGFEPGPSQCPCEDRTLGLISQPLGSALITGPDPWIPLPNSTGELDIDDSTAFLGQGCSTLVVHNDKELAIHDFLTVEVRVPASTRVRVRASADAVQACYLGSDLSGGTD